MKFLEKLLHFFKERRGGLKKVRHAQYGQCYELTKPQDIGFSRIAQGSLVNETILPSGTKTPPENLWIREWYLVRRE